MTSFSESVQEFIIYRGVDMEFKLWLWVLGLMARVRVGMHLEKDKSILYRCIQVFVLSRLSLIYEFVWKQKTI